MDSTQALNIEIPEQLTEWLRVAGRVGPREPLVIEVLKGGVSNRTVMVRRARGEVWVLKQALPRLRVTVDWFCDPARIHREALGMRWLAALAPAGTIPRLLFEDLREHVIGMQAVRQPHASWKSILMRGEVSADHIRQFAQILGAIHRQSRLASHPLREVFDDRSFYENLRIEPFYEYTATQVPTAARFLADLASETRQHRLSLVHGDYSPKNILVQGNRLVLLDHEVIHWGDPMFDVGFALAHLLSKAHHVIDARQALGGGAILFWEHYEFAACPCLASAQDQARAVRHALGCLLARVAGRSPVEYLSSEARLRQATAVGALLSQPPGSVLGLVEQFLSRLS